MTPNKAHQSGHWRAYIDTSPVSRSAVLYVMNERHVATVDSPSMTLAQPTEGTQLDDTEHAFLVWDEALEDDIVDMVKAIAKALDIYSDEPSQAYKQGFAEGEAKVLREWKDELSDKHLIGPGPQPELAQG